MQLKQMIDLFVELSKLQNEQNSQNNNTNPNHAQGPFLSEDDVKQLMQILQGLDKDYESLLKETKRYQKLLETSKNQIKKIDESFTLGKFTSQTGETIEMTTQGAAKLLIKIIDNYTNESVKLFNDLKNNLGYTGTAKNIKQKFEKIIGDEMTKIFMNQNEAAHSNPLEEAASNLVDLSSMFSAIMNTNNDRQTNQSTPSASAAALRANSGNQDISLGEALMNLGNLVNMASSVNMQPNRPTPSTSAATSRANSNPLQAIFDAGIQYGRNLGQQQRNQANGRNPRNNLDFSNANGAGDQCSIS